MERSLVEMEAPAAAAAAAAEATAAPERRWRNRVTLRTIERG
jgi:hypothetical protein